MNKKLQISLTILSKSTSPELVSLYMQPRLEGDKLKGLLEFPGGKIEPGETPRQAGARELAEETGIQIDIESLKLFKIYDVEGESGAVRLYVHICEYGGAQSSDNWYALNTKEPLVEISDKIMPSNHQIITDVVNYLARYFKTL